MHKLYSSLHHLRLTKKLLIYMFKIRGKKPWTRGYDEYKWNFIDSTLKSKKIAQFFKDKRLPEGFGIGIDERVVEYGWVFSGVKKNKFGNILDAGSVFNYLNILELDILKDKRITIFTYYPEAINYNSKRISYMYGDLRDMPLRDEYYDEIICQSTIEHIDMDNSIYGYKIKNSGNEEVKSYEYLKVIDEFLRVLSKRGVLLLTFPFGKFENHGFFQQFDSEMLNRIKHILDEKGETAIDFLKYSKNGWNYCKEEECENIVSYNPHTGRGKQDDGAAHCRAVCCIKFEKK